MTNYLHRPLVPVLVKWLVAKSKMDITATQEAMYSDLAVKAIQHMEEVAHQAIKANVNPPTGNEKLNSAVATVIAAADAFTPKNKTVVRTLESSHSSFLSKPKELAAILAQAC